MSILVKGDRVLRSRRYPQYNAQSDEVREMLGLAPKQKLPVEGMQPRLIQGIKVWVQPLYPRVKRGRRSYHRVIAQCPGCGRMLSAGRLHQHKCKTEVK